MQNNINVTVLLAIYNGEPWLSEQIKSIIAQKNIKLNLYVSDDSKKMSSSSAISSLMNSDSNLVILKQRQTQGGAGQNFFHLLKTVDFSNCEYIALSDQDDIWHDRKLTHAITAIRNNKVDAYSSNVIAFWPNGIKKRIHKAQRQCVFDYMFESAGPGCTFVLSRKLAQDLQSHLLVNDSKLPTIELHDWFIYAFSRSRGYKWFIDPKSHMLYRQHSTNVIGANFGLNAKLSRWKKLRSGWLVEQAILIADTIGYDSLWPIRRLKRLNFLDKCILALTCFKFRRRFRDQIAFAISLFLTKKI